MSQSPREADDQEPTVPTPDENEPQQPTDQQATETMNEAEGLGYDFEVKEQDRWLPIANVARIMKTALPDNAKIAKEAKECMQECVSEFISFITSEASEKCQQEKRKTVNGEDILFAMTSLGFENYGEALKIYLARYREVCETAPQRSRPKSRAESSQNLVARGEHQKPGTGTAGVTTGADGQQFDGSLGDPMDPTATEGSHDFAYGQGNGNF